MKKIQCFLCKKMLLRAGERESETCYDCVTLFWNIQNNPWETYASLKKDFDEEEAESFIKCFSGDNEPNCNVLPITTWEKPE